MSDVDTHTTERTPASAAGLASLTSSSPNSSTNTAAPPHISYIDETTGVGLFATQGYKTGDCVLRESPYVFAQSYRTWKTTPLKLTSCGCGQQCDVAEDEGKPSRGLAGASTNPTKPNSSVSLNGRLFCSEDSDPHEVSNVCEGVLDRLARVRCCFGCGAPLPQALQEESKRLDCLSRHQRDWNDVSDSRAGGDKENEQSLAHNKTAHLQSKFEPKVLLWELIHNTGTARYVAADPKDGSMSCEGNTLSLSYDTSRAYVTEVDVTGRVHVVYFCGLSCEAHSLRDDGKRFVLSQLKDYNSALSKTASTAESTSPFVLSSSANGTDVEALRYPTYDTILHAAQHPTTVTTRRATWPTRLSLLSTVHSIARRCNERIWLLVLLMAKELHLTVSLEPALLSLSVLNPPSHFTSSLNGSSTDEIVVLLTRATAESFRTRLEALCEQYAEGAMQVLNAEQRALLRFSRQLLTWWLVLCCLEVMQERRTKEEQNAREDSIPAQTGTESRGATRLTPLESFLSSMANCSLPGTITRESFEASVLSRLLHVAETVAFPLQLYLRLYWLTNANAHMYVVASPFYTLWCRWLADVQFSPSTDSTSAKVQNKRTTEERKARLELFSRLYALFYGTKAWSAKLHASASVPSFSPSPPSLTGDVLHATGVALYDTATKLNHSCAPNVCFEPNHGAVEASVVALREIAAGEELLTSYIRPEQFEGDVAADANTATHGRATVAALLRQRYLLMHYGFLCNCPLCACAAEDSGEVKKETSDVGCDMVN